MGLALLAALALVAAGCGRLLAPPPAPETRLHRVEAEAGACAWYGDRYGDLLYFGISRYWNAARRAGATSALETLEPMRIGRFDLAAEQMLSPLELGRLARGGVWDVLALSDRRVIYTGLSESAGWVDPIGSARGALSTGRGSNELAALPDGRIVMTQYFEGELLVFDESGALERRYSLAAPPATRVAPKSLAFDRTRGRAGWIWVTTDLFPEVPGAAPGHDARAIDLESGAERRRLSTPELQNLVFDRAGNGFFVWSTASGLALQILSPSDAIDPEAGRLIVLSAGFDATRDFAQDAVVAPGGQIVVTLWSGLVFVVNPRGGVRSVQLPRDPPESLYYSAALRDNRVCATRCAGVSVVCADLP